MPIKKQVEELEVGAVTISFGGGVRSKIDRRQRRRRREIDKSITKIVHVLCLRGRLILQKFAPRSKFSSEYKLLKVILQSSNIVCKTDSEVFFTNLSIFDQAFFDFLQNQSGFELI